MTTATKALPARFDDSAESWERTLYAFLAEKERRSGSRRTVESYDRMLHDFFGRAAKTPDEVTIQDVFAWAHGVGLSGREPSAVTIGARMACVSSFYRFMIRMGIAVTNPCDALERPNTQAPPPRGLTADQVRQLLAVIPDSPAGRRDRALILTYVLTGRRRSEVLNLTAGDITVEGDTAFYSYRGKGGKRGRRELSRPAYDAIVAALADRDVALEALDPSTPFWSVTSATFYQRFRRYLKRAGLPASGLHVLRHTAAKLRRDVGESVETVSAFLDHSTLATTTVYLRRLEGQRDGSWERVAEAIGA
jgi:integrase/recombinase XerC